MVQEIEIVLWKMSSELYVIYKMDEPLVYRTPWVVARRCRLAAATERRRHW